MNEALGTGSPLLRTPRECERPYSISEVNRALALIIEGGTQPVWLQGEISNFRKATSGHCYFTLKDDQSQIPAVMWRSSVVRLRFEPENGMEVTAIAAIRVYQKGGYYQLDIQRMQPSGLGALYAAFEQLKKKLQQEGLFDPGRKRPLPETVSRVGVITSKQGAAIRDIITVIRTRAPQTDIVLIDVPVQGDTAAARIAEAIRDMNGWGGVDCMIVGRGGGSVEDLWAFNEEVVARAIAGSDIPVVSAVGHEVDFTIADFVADVRAPTPSAAAETVVPDTRQNKRYFDSTAVRFRAAFLQLWEERVSTLRRLAQCPALRRGPRLLVESRQAHDQLQQRCFAAMRQRMDQLRIQTAHASSHLGAVSPLDIMSRGYSVVLAPDGRAVVCAGQLEPGDALHLRFHQGQAQATVTSIAGQR